MVQTQPHIDRTTESAGDQQRRVVISPTDARKAERVGLYRILFLSLGLAVLAGVLMLVIF
jgi:hypothetical protein